MGCKRAQEFLARRGIEAAETRSATRNPLLRADVPSLLEGVGEVLVARGRKFDRFDLSDAGATAEVAERIVGSGKSLADRLLGRTGKLRAPTIRTGDTLLVGFHADMYEQTF